MLALLGEIHRSPVDSPHRGPVMRKAFPCHDVIPGPCLTYSDLTLSQAFQPMAAQLSMKAAPPLAKILATASLTHLWCVVAFRHVCATPRLGCCWTTPIVMHRLWRGNSKLYYSQSHVATLIARFMGPTWGPPGADRAHVGPMKIAIWVWSIHKHDQLVHKLLKSIKVK